MKIVGDLRPYTNKDYSYSLENNVGEKIKVDQWIIYQNNKILISNTKGIFKFSTNTAGLILKLVARVKKSKTHESIDYSVEIKPLIGKPQILDLYWKDINNESIATREIAYLDNVTLVVKTKNIPQGDTLEITLYEDEYVDGHGDSSRKMGQYTITVSKNGYSYWFFDNIKLYQKILNKLDYTNEDTHEFYVGVKYRKKLNVIKDKIQLKVKNKLKQMIQPYTGNSPVVVGNTKSVAKEQKKAVNFTFGVFLDGTLNNMYDTEIRQKAEGKPLAGASGLSVSKEKAVTIYKKHGDTKNKESSYENDLSNPAILYKNYDNKPENKIFRIYTEGIGTNSAPKKQGGYLREEDYKKNDILFGPAFGMGNSGIMSNVRKAIVDVVKVLKKIDSKAEKIGTITFDVFGFSRGAAAARHFVHIVTHPAYNPKVFRGEYGVSVLDLQDNLLPISYVNKTMPHFGVLGQLLQEAGLLDAQTKVVVRFVGIYDTVPHHGLFQWNDIEDLGLDSVNKANYVVHMVAADEHRANFSLVDISSVTKTSPKSGKKGGIELIYPGVHSDVGGSYEEGEPYNPQNIGFSIIKSDLELLRKELINQGWFKDEEIFIEQNFWSVGGKYNLKGNRFRVSNQYSYISLHIMARFCTLKKVPVNEAKVLEFKNFTNNFVRDNISFLNKIKRKLEDYTFSGGEQFTFVEPGVYKEPPIMYATGSPNAHKAIVEWEKRQREGQKKLDAINDDIKYLRNHYLHWNSTYGGIGTNIPNIVKGKRKRHVR
uniref:T6SS phospholipase effector Tle1-like catalytic domain-containing protein n=1 Tax=Ornithobacterium rhinotracheale TaxID=28251 RepID=UPI0039A5DC86